MHCVLDIFITHMWVQFTRILGEIRASFCETTYVDWPQCRARMKLLVIGLLFACVMSARSAQSLMTTAIPGTL